MTFKEWINQKFSDWQKAQGRSQSYYSFAHFLGVSQTAVSTWMEGTALPEGDDLTVVAAKLGSDVYSTLGMPRPDSSLEQLVAAFPVLPVGLRERLSGAASEAGRLIRENHYPPESIEAKKVVIEVLARWGIRLTN